MPVTPCAEIEVSESKILKRLLQRAMTNLVFRKFSFMTKEALFHWSKKKEACRSSTGVYILVTSVVEKWEGCKKEKKLSSLIRVA